VTDHPIRVLQNLTGYEVAKPLVMNRLAFAAMAEIACHPEGFTHRHTPLDVTDALWRARSTRNWSATRAGQSRSKFGAKRSSSTTVGVIDRLTGRPPLAWNVH
jgi:hypothetical protein